MKKTYIIPQTRQYTVRTVQMMASSPGLKSGNYSDQYEIATKEDTFYDAWDED